MELQPTTSARSRLIGMSGGEKAVTALVRVFEIRRRQPNKPIWILTIACYEPDGCLNPATSLCQAHSPSPGGSNAAASYTSRAYCQVRSARRNLRPICGYLCRPAQSPLWLLLL